MADLKISDLAESTTPASTDLLEAEVGGVSKKVTIGNVVKQGMVYASAAEIVAGTEAAKTIAPDQLAASNVGVPAGAEMLWPTETAPTGWLEENGASLLRADYAALFAVIGTMYGTADGTHFNLPDMRGRFPRGWAHGSTNDPDRAARTAPTTSGATIVAGDHVGSEQADEFKSHTHAQAEPAAGTGFAGGAGYNFTTTSPTGATGGNETRPINAARMVIIKY